MFFIHTFSMIKVFKKREEVEQLWKIYNQKNITEKKVFRINEFSDKGVRLVIRDLEKQRKRFEKVTTEVEIIVTPYKLLHNGEALGRLTTEEEYTEAIQELRKILHEIWDTTEVDLQDAELNRIDVTYDIVTPSQKYTREIIAALKVMHLKNGYTPISKEILDGHVCPVVFLLVLPLGFPLLYNMLLLNKILSFSSKKTPTSKVGDELRLLPT